MTMIDLMVNSPCGGLPLAMILCKTTSAEVIAEALKIVQANAVAGSGLRDKNFKLCVMTDDDKALVKAFAIVYVFVESKLCMWHVLETIRRFSLSLSFFWGNIV